MPCQSLKFWNGLEELVQAFPIVTVHNVIMCSKKPCHCWYLNNSVKQELTLITSGMQRHEET